MSASQKVVVVGVDFGSSGDAAILAGLEQLAAGNARAMHVMHVLDPREVIDYPEKRAIETEEEMLERAPRLLAERVRELAILAKRDYSPRHIHTHARLGKPVETLLQTCVDYDADLLIVGTHGRRGLDRVLIGSVAEALVRTARCPVLVARAKSYVGCKRTELPDPPFKPGEAPKRELPREVTDHVTSTQLESWHPSDNGPTGFRIV